MPVRSLCHLEATLPTCQPSGPWARPGEALTDPTFQPSLMWRSRLGVGLPKVTCQVVGTQRGSVTWFLASHPTPPPPSRPVAPPSPPQHPGCALTVSPRVLVVQ